MKTEFSKSPDRLDPLNTPGTRFAFGFSFQVETYYSDDREAPEYYRPEYVNVWFELRFPEGPEACPYLEYQINENAQFYYVPISAVVGKDDYFPRTRRLSADGLREIFSWLEKVNIWEWEPPDCPTEKDLSVFSDLDVRYKHADSDISFFESRGYLEVSYDGKTFRQFFPIKGAPAPSAYAFDEGAWSLDQTSMVPIMANHLLFLTNDPIIVELTKRLLRLLPEKKARKQIAKFDDGMGTKYEVDFANMKARKITKAYGFGLGRIGILPPRVTEMKISEYDRMRLWCGLLDCKSTDKGFRPSASLDETLSKETCDGKLGRRWSAELCDGKSHWRFEAGRLAHDEPVLLGRFHATFESLFGGNISPLPRLPAVESKYVVGGVLSNALEAHLDKGLPQRIYNNTVEERILKYRTAHFSNDGLEAGALLGDIDCMLKMARWGSDSWYEEAARLGNPEAMFFVANKLLSIKPGVPNSGKDNKDPDGVARKYYEAAFLSGYTKAALGLGYIYEFGIGLPVDRSTAVSYYIKSLAGTSPLDEGNFFVYDRLWNLLTNRIGPVFDLLEGEKYHALLSVGMTQRRLSAAELEAKRAQKKFEQAKKDHLDAEVRLAKQPRVRRLTKHPMEEYEIGKFDDYSAFMKIAPDSPPEGVYVPMFCAELLRKGEYVGTVFCINLGSADGPVMKSWAGLRIGGEHTFVRFVIDNDDVGLAVSDSLVVGRKVDGSYHSKHRLIIDTTEATTEAVAGTPEWDRHWAEYFQLMAKVRPFLGDPGNPNHCSRKRYVDHLRQTGLQPDPFIKDVSEHVGSVGRAELLRWHQMALVLARTLKKHEALSDIALAEAARVTQSEMPDLKRNDKGALWNDYQFLAFATKFLSRKCPIYYSMSTFIDANKVK